MLRAEPHPGPMERVWNQDKCPSDALIICLINHCKETVHLQSDHIHARRIMGGINNGFVCARSRIGVAELNN